MNGRPRGSSTVSSTPFADLPITVLVCILPVLTVLRPLRPFRRVTADEVEVGISFMLTTMPLPCCTRVLSDPFESMSASSTKVLSVSREVLYPRIVADLEFNEPVELRSLHPRRVEAEWIGGQTNKSISYGSSLVVLEYSANGDLICIVWGSLSGKILANPSRSSELIAVEGMR